MQISAIAKMVYGTYNEADRLVETNGCLSLNLRPGACQSIATLLDLNDGDRVLWIGCGTGPELITMAIAHPTVRFVGIDVNDDAVRVAKRKIDDISHPLDNLRIVVADAFAYVADEPPTHVYSTAVAGPSLYDHLRRLAGHGVLCMLKNPMWQGHVGGRIAPVRLCGSGERRELMAMSLAPPRA